MVKEGGPLKTLTCGLNETGSHSKVWSGNDLSRPTGMGTGPSEPQGGTSVCSLQPLSFTILAVAAFPATSQPAIGECRGRARVCRGHTAAETTQGLASWFPGLPG